MFLASFDSMSGNVRMHHPRWCRLFNCKGQYMSNKIYVGNINYTTTENSLSSLFSQYGEVLSVNIIKDRFTDQSKGFGFIEMENSEAAVNAIGDLNGKELDGRTLRVNEAENKPRENRGGRGNYRNNY